FMETKKFLTFGKTQFGRVDNIDISRATSPSPSPTYPPKHLYPTYHQSTYLQRTTKAPISNVPPKHLSQTYPPKHLPPTYPSSMCLSPILVLTNEDFNPKWLESVKQELYKEFLKQRIFELEKTLNQEIIELEKNGHLQHESRLLKAKKAYFVINKSVFAR
ncbi:13688_t:CDS:1, partial [Gigaspora margarita]